MKKDSEKRYNPNEGQGSVISNITGEPIKTVFTYGNLTKEQKEVAEEIAKLIEQNSSISTKILPSFIRKKFEIEKIPEKDIKTTLWYKLTKDFKLGQSIQGFREENGIRIPHVSISADIDYLDEVLIKMINNIKDELKKEETFTKESIK